MFNRGLLPDDVWLDPNLAALRAKIPASPDGRAPDSRIYDFAVPRPVPSLSLSTSCRAYRKPLRY